MYSSTITVTTTFQNIFSGPLNGWYSILIAEQAENFNSGVVTIQEHGNAGNIVVENVDMRGFIFFPRFLPTTFTFDEVRFYNIQKVGDFLQINHDALSTDILVSFTAYSDVAATSLNSPDTLVLRDSNGDFAAGIITADLNGNATSATSAADFTGSLAGDVTGTQSSTVISFVGGQTASNVAAGTVLANDATPLNVPNTIVKRNANGDFAASAITNTNLTSSGVINLLNTTSSSTGIVNKGGSRFLHNFGTNNIFLGINSGNFTLTSARCVGVGQSALSNLTSAVDCTAIGYLALQFVQSTNSHTAVGSGALRLTTTGSNCTAVGYNALTANTGGDDCSALGAGCLSSNSTGINNTGFGTYVLRSITTNSNCTGCGVSALEFNTADSMTAFGAFALGSNTSGVRSTAVGVVSLQNNLTGNDCTALGFQALRFSTGSGNIGVGSNAGGNIVNSSNNIDIGNQGILGDSGVIRLGTTGTHLKNFQAGIRGITADLSDSIPVYISSTGQFTTVGVGKASGTIYTNGGGTTVVPAATWTLLTGITASGILNNFSRPADNRLAYTGSGTINVLITVAASISTNAASTIVYLTISENGSTPSSFQGAVGNVTMTTGVTVNFSPSVILSLTTNDYVSVFVNSSSAATITTSTCTINAIAS